MTEPLPDPYYQDDHVTLYNADCLTVLEHHAGWADMVFTSPPYNKGDTNGNEWARLDGNGYETHTDRMPEPEYVQWQHRVLTACWEALNPTGAIFYNHKPIAKGDRIINPLRLIPPELPVRQIITWDRGSGFQRDGYHLTPEYEWVIVIAKPDFRIHDRTIGDVWRIPPKPDPNHPAPFPIGLPNTALRATNAQRIIDPYAGTGTTLRAAKNHGRQAIGAETNPNYCATTKQRLAQETIFGTPNLKTNPPNPSPTNNQ